MLGYEQNLLDNDYSSFQEQQPYNSSSSNWRSRRQRSSQRRTRPSATNNTLEMTPYHSYVPPRNNGYENNNVFSSSYLQQKLSSSVYSSAAPKSPSMRRALFTQTPSRTSEAGGWGITGGSGRGIIDNETEGEGDRIVNGYNPAVDLGANSCFSYGCFCVQCIRTTEVGVVENCGRFETFLSPGLHIIPWPYTDISGRLSLRIRLLSVTCESLTLDQIFLTLTLTLSYRTIPEKSYDAYYRSNDPTQQIQSLASDVVRSTLPKLTMDDVFRGKDYIAKEVTERIEVVMESYGYEVVGVMVTDVRPAGEVRMAMEGIFVQKRLRVAMAHKAEAEKIKVIKDAEAHCESLYLSGVGTAAQRKALAHELSRSVSSHHHHPPSDQRSSCKGTTSSSVQEVMNLLLLTLYLDTITEVSAASSIRNSSNGKDTIVMGLGPVVVQDVQRQLKEFPS